MKFLAFTLIVHAPDPITGVQKSATERFREVIGNALTPRFRPPLRQAEVWPRPLQQPIRVWHGSATSKDSVDVAARYGDPLVAANVTSPIEPDAELVRHYRERWAHYGHDPARAVAGAGTAGYYAARNSQDALALYRPIFDAQRVFQLKLALPPVFADLDDFVARSSPLIGSPQQVAPVLRRELPDPPWPGAAAADPALASSAT
jgi:alkanesulfonate monooxygenase SsuD/methylene tetrahydromethanopterin reductase-like flavin-dependent oxidoreductase (luciferase family)